MHPVKATVSFRSSLVLCVAAAISMAVWFLLPVMQTGGAVFRTKAHAAEAPAPAVGKWKTWQDFVRDHWAYPLAPMGAPPATHKTEAERSLLPESCGSCHPDQFNQWKTSLHAQAMSPGFYGQTIEMWPENPEGAQGCNECHAPLGEQQKKMQTGKGPFAEWAANPAHNHKLELAGLACAACHVRSWRIHGPPKRETKPGVSDATTTGAHGGVERTPLFERAEFCMKCHQHQTGGPNGKPIQNTYNEWKASLWAKEGVQCQNCHMPQRQHLWRGIHDKDMTQGAVTLDVELNEEAPKGVVAAKIVLTNTGAGHHFPTYITPSVDVIAELEDASGKPISGTRRTVVIERKLSADFSQEIHDTRIPPQEAFTMTYRRNRPAEAARLRVRVHVRPDAFYLGFFMQMLRNPNLSPKARKLITEAKERAASSPFDIFDDRIDLGG